MTERSLIEDIHSKSSGISCTILSQLSLEQYIPLFRKENIDLDSFLNLRKDQYITLGIKNPGDLWLLINCSKQLKSHINRHSICEEEQEENDDDDFYSITSNQSNISLSSSIQVISNVLHTYDSTIRPSKSLLAPPGTVIPRHRNTKLTRPVSMPTPPPCYHQEMLFAKRLDKSKSMIFPREEEGNEELPAYSCTVYKMGYVYIKREYDAPNIKSKWRSWKKLYVELWGTLLKVYRAAPSPTIMTLDDTKKWSIFYQYYHNYYYTPIYTLSLAGAEATRAFDYSRRPNALRLSTQHGPQLLMRLSSHIEMISWIEHLQAAINISLDLEYRPMPKFITIQSRGFANSVLDSRTIELERAREQRRREQREMLI